MGDIYQRPLGKTQGALGFILVLGMVVLAVIPLWQDVWQLLEAQNPDVSVTFDDDGCLHLGMNPSHGCEF